MKFCKHYEGAYRQLSDTWPIFINYKDLKKSIRNIVAELENKGFHVNDKGEVDRKLFSENVLQYPPVIEVNYIIERSEDGLKPIIELSVLSDTLSKILPTNDSETQCDTLNCPKHMSPDSCILKSPPDIVSTQIYMKKSQMDILQQLDKIPETYSSSKAHTTSRNLNLRNLPGNDLNGKEGLREHRRKLVRSWTYHPNTTLKEYNAYQALLKECHASKDSIKECRASNTTLKRIENTSEKSKKHKVANTSSPDILAVSSISPLYSNMEQERFIVPLSNNVLVKRPALLKTLSYDLITSRRTQIIDDICFRNNKNANGSPIKRLLMEFDLKSDIDFLKDLYKAFSKIVEFEKEYFITATSKSHQLVNKINMLASPYSGDYKKWKKLLSLYVNSHVWFHNSGGFKSYESSRECLMKFEKAISNRQKIFRKKDSCEAFDDFVKFNREHLSARLFEEINYTAIRKILKKHDRHTHLQAGPMFMSLLESSKSSPLEVIRSLTFTIHEKFISVVPLPLNYSCPICDELYWKPVRLTCNHVFCLRCIVKAQLMKIRDCPLCRHNGAVATATYSNYDRALANFLMLYFPKEVSSKSKNDMKEKAKEECRALTQSIFMNP